MQSTAFAPHEMAQEVPGPEPGADGNLCLLALDGGGVRGLSELYILKRVMEGID